MNANAGVVCAQFESALINSSGICFVSFVCFVVIPPPPGSRRFCCRGFDLRFGVDKFFARRANSDRVFYRSTQMRSSTFLPYLCSSVFICGEFPLPKLTNCAARRETHGLLYKRRGGTLQSHLPEAPNWNMAHTIPPR